MADIYNSSGDPLPFGNISLCAQDGDGQPGANCTDLNLPKPSTSPYPETDDIDHDDIWTPDVIQRVASLAFIIALTLVGNTVIIIVLTCSRYRKRNSRVNIFIINLAIGDLAVCGCTMTTEILFVAFGEWVLGPATCKILTYLEIVTLASTTFILTSMSFDRYLAICKPLKYRATTSRAKKFIACSWVLAFVFAVPQLFIFVQTVNKETGKISCRSHGYTAEWQRKAYFSFMTMYILVVPVCLITFCYSSIVHVISKVGRDVEASAKANNCALRRSIVDSSTFPRAKIKTLKMTFAIIATFVICWTPYFVTTLIKIYSNYTIEFSPSVMAFAETIALLQSGLNPLLYGCFTIKISRGLMEVFCPFRLKNLRRTPSFNKSGGVTECYSMTEEAMNGKLHHGEVPVTRRNCSARLRESVSNGSNNSTSSSAADTKNRVITEENKNGIRLRVRFAPKECMQACVPKFTEKALSNETLEIGDGDSMLPKHSCLKHPAAQYYK